MQCVGGLMRNRFGIIKKLLYKLYIKEEKTCKEIAKILRCSYTTILKYLKKYNIRIRRKGPRLNPEIILTSKEIQIINGMLLGDGSLPISKKYPNANARLTYCSINKDICIWLNKQLESIKFN